VWQLAQRALHGREPLEETLDSILAETEDSEDDRSWEEMQE
jgi:hypothetical protein